MITLTMTEQILTNALAGAVRDNRLHVWIRSVLSGNTEEWNDEDSANFENYELWVALQDKAALDLANIYQLVRHFGTEEKMLADAIVNYIRSTQNAAAVRAQQLA